MFSQQRMASRYAIDLEACRWTDGLKSSASRCFLVLLLSMTACANSTSNQHHAPTKQSVCYMGESRFLQADGRRIFKYQTLIQQTLLPAVGRVQEKVAIFFPGYPVGVHKTSLSLRADGSFRVHSVDDSLIGEGTRSGATWPWHTWQTQTKPVPAIEVTSTANVTGEELIGITKVRVNGTDISYRVKDRLSRIPNTECVRRLSRVSTESVDNKSQACADTCYALNRCRAQLAEDHPIRIPIYCQDLCTRRRHVRIFACLSKSEAMCSNLMACLRGHSFE